MSTGYPFIVKYSTKYSQEGYLFSAIDHIGEMRNQVYIANLVSLVELGFEGVLVRLNGDLSSLSVGKVFLLRSNRNWNLFPIREREREEGRRGRQYPH